MKLSELKLFEYNKTRGLGSHIQIDQLQKYLNDSTMLRTHIVTGENNPVNICTIHRFDFGGSTCIYILKDKLSTVIVGYLTLQKVKDDIWQTLELNIFPKFQGLGLATELYARVVSVDKKHLINGDGLSPAAEKLWAALIRDKKCKHIYDRKLNKIYKLSDIGNTASDGVEIKSPTEDSDIEEPGNIRFFYLAEMLHTFREYSSEQQSDIYESWLRNVPFVFEESGKTLVCGGLSTVAMSQDGDE